MRFLCVLRDFAYPGLLFVCTSSLLRSSMQKSRSMQTRPCVVSGIFKSYQKAAVMQGLDEAEGKRLAFKTVLVNLPHPVLRQWKN